MSEKTDGDRPDPANPERRSFLTGAAAAGIGGVIGVVPVLAGLGVLLDPLKRKSGGGTLSRIASLESVPADGTPRLFPVIATRVDAWNRTTGPVGSVYVRRTGEKTVEVFNVTCPHAGCAVEFRAEKKGYFCPCHNSTFSMEGKRSESSPAARDLDTLDHEIREDGGIWVKFQNFQTGHSDKVPVA